MSRSPYSTSHAPDLVPPPIHPKLRRTRGASRAPILPAVSPENLARVEDLRRDFASFLDRAQYVKRYSRFTLAWFQNGFANYQRYLLEGGNLAAPDFALRIQALDQWIAWNTHRGLAEITMNNLWRSLKAFFDDRATVTRAANPFQGRKAPRARTPAPKARSAQDCAAILHAARALSWKTDLQRELAVAVLGTMLYAGLRKSELFRLTDADVDLDEGTIRVIKGKGRYGGKDRMAFIAPDLARMLRAYVAARDHARLGGTTFFLSPIKGRPLSEGSLRDIVRKVAAASRIAFSPHILRHSFVTHLLRSGVPIHVVRDLAGHASFETTLGYTAVFDEDRTREIRKLRFGR